MWLVQQSCAMVLWVTPATQCFWVGRGSCAHACGALSEFVREVPKPMGHNHSSSTHCLLPSRAQHSIGTVMNSLDNQASFSVTVDSSDGVATELGAATAGCQLSDGTQ